MNPKFKINDCVVVVGPNAKAVHGMYGEITNIQEYSKDNFYFVNIDRHGRKRTVGVFENELRLVERKSHGTLNE